SMRCASLALALASSFLTAGTAAAQEVLSPYDQPAPPAAGPALPPAPLPPTPPPLVVAPPPMAPCLSVSCGPPRIREVDQPRYGLMIAGLAVLGASWSINAAVAYAANEWRLAVPVAGPFLETQRLDTSDVGNRMLVGMLIFDGLVETAGAT